MNEINQKLKITAAVLSAIVSIASIGIDVVAFLYNSCVITYVKSGDSPFTRFLNQHLIGSSGDCLTGHAWYYCNGKNLECSINPLHWYTGPDSVMVFVWMHLILHSTWLLTIPSLFWGPRERIVAWQTLTLICLVFGLVTCGMFSVEIVDAYGLLECNDDADTVRKYVVAQLILPLYLSYGVLFWLLLAITVFLMCCKQCSSTPTQQLAVAKVKARSLSDAHSGDFSTRLNKRFDQADAIEYHESRFASKVMTTGEHYPRESKTTGDWVYSNPSFVRESFGGGVHHRISETSQELLYATPKTFATSTRRPPYTQSVSANESEVSESRRIGRPMQMPAIDYPLPRARVSTTTTSLSRSEINQKSPRKAIRTPSGRSISAMEYLRGGFAPVAHKTVSEESSVHSYDHYEANKREDDKGVERYFVKLKQ